MSGTIPKRSPPIKIVRLKHVTRHTSRSCGYDVTAMNCLYFFFPDEYAVSKTTIFRRFITFCFPSDSTSRLCETRDWNFRHSLGIEVRKSRGWNLTGPGQTYNIYNRFHLYLCIIDFFKEIFGFSISKIINHFSIPSSPVSPLFVLILAILLSLSRLIYGIS